MISLRLSLRSRSLRPRLLGVGMLILAGSVLAVIAVASSTTSTLYVPANMQIIHIPARIADLEFSYARPLDFQAVALPEEKVDFENPAAFYPLEITSATDALAMFWVSARPAYGDGTFNTPRSHRRPLGDVGRLDTAK
jgi:hypothetical protein